MKLVGATDWFIRWPFVLEGVLVGALGGVLAVLLLAVVKIALVDPLADRLRADRRAATRSNFRAADRRAARRLRRGLGARLRHLAAPLPARLDCDRVDERVAVPWSARMRRRRPWVPCCSSSLPVAAGRRASGSAATRRPARAACATRSCADSRGAPLRRGDRHHRARLLPQGRPQRSCSTTSLDRGGRARSTTASRNYFSPQGLRRLPAGHRGPLRGRRHDRRAGQRRACASITVYEGSPAKRGGLSAGDVITARQRPLARGHDAPTESTTLIKGPAGTEVTLTVRTTARTRERDAQARRRSTIPVVQSEMQHADGQQDRLRAPRRLHRRARGDEVRHAVKQAARPGREGRRARPARQRRRPAQRGGARSPRSSSPTAASSRPRAARGPSTSTTPRAARSPAKIPVVVLVNDGSRPRRRRSSPARCRTASGRRSSARARSARASSRRSSGCPTAARSTSRSASTSCPSGRNLGGGGVKQRRGHHARTSRPRTTRRRPSDEALRAALARGRVKHRPRRAGRGARHAARSSRVLEKRGRFLAATPFFARGRRINVDQPRTGGAPARRPRAGRAARPRRRARQGRAPDRAPGRRARRDRGADARPRAAAALRPAGRARGARGAAVASASADGPRATCATLPTFTIDPPTARDFDDAISAEELDDGAVRVWVHIADVAAHVRPGSAVDREAFRRGTSVYVPGAGRADAARGAVQPAPARSCPDEDRLAVTVELEFDGAKRAAQRVPPLAHPLRRAARLPARSTAIFAGARARRGAVGGAAGRRARASAAALQAAREARGALAVESVEPEFALLARGPRDARCVPTEQTESHRLIEHLMIAANEAVATLLETRKLPALYRVHERPEPPRVERLVDAARVARRPDAAAAAST